MDKVFLVKRVAEKLWSTEDAIDAAIAETSKLINEVIDARQELQIPHLLIGEATTKLAASMAAIAEARKAMIEAHHALNETRLRIGVRMEIPEHSLRYHGSPATMRSKSQTQENVG